MGVERLVLQSRDDPSGLGVEQRMEGRRLRRIGDEVAHLAEQFVVHPGIVQVKPCETLVVKVFLSSVRRGLEEERDALPGLIQALGHEPRRFEDFSATGIPSRQACLDGVEDADAYLLLLGEHYGDPLPETGIAPTEEEFAVAKRRGIPILAFRKRGVTLEPAQEEFIERIEAYSTGVFRKAFSNSAGLLAEVARGIRELDLAPPTLRFTPLPNAVTAPWKTFERHGWRSTAAILELVAIPLPPVAPTATELSAMPGRIARLGREHGFFHDAHALDSGVANSAAHAATRPDRSVPIAGIGMTASGAISIWQELPSDGLGAILDEADLGERIASTLRLATELVPSGCQVALAVGLHGLGSVTEGHVADLGHRRSASMPGFGYEKDALVEPRDSLPSGSLAPAAQEIARELAVRLILTFRDAFRF